MEKILVISLCCLCLCGCNKNKNQDNNTQKKNEEKITYLCSMYDYRGTISSVEIEIKNDIIIKEKQNNNYACVNDTTSPIYNSANCTLIEGYKESYNCDFSDGKPCMYQKEEDNILTKIAIQNLEDSTTMMETITKEYDNSNSVNYSEVINKYTDNNYHCKIKDTNE